MSEVSESRGRWILGSLTVILMVPVVFIVGIVVGVNIEREVSLSQDNLSSWVSAFATVTIAVLTIVLAKETWALRLIQLAQIEQIRKDSIKPSVNLYLKANPVGMNFLDIHVKNSGPGAAQNIRFTFRNASAGLEPVFANFLEQLNELAILEKGISSLGPGEHRSSFVLSFHEFYQKHGEKALELNTEVDIEFEDIEGAKYRSRAFFNFTEYKGVSGLGDGDPLHEIASHLKKIKEEIGHFSSGFKKIKADVYTSEDRERERQLWEERRREHEKQKSESG
ncbi:hypothetical protein [Desulfuromonas thiophila]|uniref:Uncharacterized protein n=1 Tax=Desulfuromonas thiophila TaxID=57664 RepID=A0A1G7B5N7_9BACT|nr:hypothetical protein [Desulfuromonas thiophila]SDE22180.1 hypothetical protein SAMN05661003_10569 [Desulfuromonas thiophila]